MSGCALVEKCVCEFVPVPRGCVYVCAIVCSVWLGRSSVVRKMETQEGASQHMSQLAKYCAVLQ